VILPIDSYSPLLFLFLCLVFFLFNELFSVYIVYAILSSLRKNTASYSKNTYRLHYQLTLLLAFQLAIPFFFIILPISIRWVIFFTLNHDFAIFNHFRMTLITLYGFASSIFTLIFIAPYREHLYDNLIYPIGKALGIKRLKPRKISTAWVTNTKKIQKITTIANVNVVVSD
jgi:hypothetical protein